MLPEVGKVIWFTWGEVIVKAKVITTTPSLVFVLDTTDLSVFGGSPTAHNINFNNQEWVYDSPSS